MSARPGAGRSPSTRSISACACAAPRSPHRRPAALARPARAGPGRGVPVRQRLIRGSRNRHESSSNRLPPTARRALGVSGAIRCHQERCQDRPTAVTHSVPEPALTGHHAWGFPGAHRPPLQPPAGMNHTFETQPPITPGGFWGHQERCQDRPTAVTHSVTEPALTEHHTWGFPGCHRPPPAASSRHESYL